MSAGCACIVAAIDAWMDAVGAFCWLPATTDVLGEEGEQAVASLPVVRRGVLPLAGG